MELARFLYLNYFARVAAASFAQRSARCVNQTQAISVVHSN